ncbi:Histone acetyltransferase HPA2 and related acetyltransferases [Paraburkholderia unamae]|uniref:GNAT family N-acetyltransferase n=1 Tax=Paraburkholderia unamae TaxID=219649 RepID=UPI001CB38FB5|nr:GNAT family N-acetyltransferase [Paraburkholderia unamae]CAG9251478.1 Histone acetyltransferase HPA2 and related acetyltransferases [Paraburkholderia unamae]
MSGQPASPSLVCETFSDSDVEGAHALSLQFGWPHTREDWRFAAATGRGFVVRESGTVIGTALCWPWGERGATLGLVVVAANQQGRGIGRMLMERLLDALGPRMTVLHATQAGQPLYEKLGFRKVGLLHQYQGTGFAAPFVEPPPGERLRPLEAGDTPRLIELATRASGLDRSALLPPLLDMSQGVALVKGDTVVGFALLRPFGRGHAIGPVPVIADDGLHGQRAQALIANRLAANAGAFTRLDTPDEQGLGPWLESVGLARVDTVVKMARNGEPARDPATLQYAIVTQALG